MEIAVAKEIAGMKGQSLSQWGDPAHLPGYKHQPEDSLKTGSIHLINYLLTNFNYLIKITKVNEHMAR